MSVLKDKVVLITGASSGFGAAAAKLFAQEGCKTVLAARRSIVTVEEIVDRLAAPPNAVVIPHWAVGAVCEVRGGAFPSYAHGYYARANAFYKQWDDVSRERETFQNWIKRHVMETTDFAGFRRSLDEAAAPAFAEAPARSRQSAERGGGHV